MLLYDCCLIIREQFDQITPFNQNQNQLYWLNLSMANKESLLRSRYFGPATEVKAKQIKRQVTNV